MSRHNAKTLRTRLNPVVPPCFIHPQTVRVNLTDSDFHTRGNDIGYLCYGSSRILTKTLEECLCDAHLMSV